MKKAVRFVALMMLICTMFSLGAYAYGTSTFVQNGVTYVATDRASVYYVGTDNDTLCVDAACDINPAIRHYSTADIRKGNRNGTIVATSGRQWTDQVTSSATCTAPRSSSDLKGFGWWGHE